MRATRIDTFLRISRMMASRLSDSCANAGPVQHTTPRGGKGGGHLGGGQVNKGRGKEKGSERGHRQIVTSIPLWFLPESSPSSVHSSLFVPPPQKGVCVQRQIFARNKKTWLEFSLTLFVAAEMHVFTARRDQEIIVQWQWLRRWKQRQHPTVTHHL